MEGRKKRETAAGIKGEEADKERLWCMCVRNRKKERDIITWLGGREKERKRRKERKTTTRESRGDGGTGDVCTLKYYSQMKYRAGPAGTQRVRIFLDLI